MSAEKIRYALNICEKWIKSVVPPGRRIDVFEDDIFVVSYPKSGNTWVRFMLGNLYSNEGPVSFANIERKVPDIYQNSARVLARMQRPRILKSHEYLDPRYRRVIYIARDPRDVATSYYHHMIKMRVIENTYSKSAFVERFVSGDLDPFGSWMAHVGGWIGARKAGKDFLLIKYEDLLDNPVAELSKIAAFLNFSGSQEQIVEAVEMSSFRRMQTLEKAESDMWAPIKSGLKEKPFVRKAQKGAWQNELPKEAVNMIETEWSETMSSLEYRLNQTLPVYSV